VTDVFGVEETLAEFDEERSFFDKDWRVILRQRFDKGA
jgi:hypothetical protein